MTAKTKKKRKVVSAIAAVATAAAIMLTGTFAWQSISQKVLNEAASDANPGGRLHDDFNGENKDIYVENFGSQPIFARVRLSEYMETGKDAGVKKNDANRNATPVLPGTNINDVNTWEVHKPVDAHDAFHNDYWDWDMDGSTVFMPTFNKDKDSLEADVNGTFAGLDGDPTTNDDRYDDYHAYTLGETKTADAVYDATTKVNETHTAKSTLNGTVMSMADWKNATPKPENCWVYDEDGWAYWSSPIAPGEATGLLLDGIKLKQDIPEWYYAINVEGQFATADDIGKQTDSSGFFKDGMSDEALALLGSISGNIALDVTAENGAKTVLQNDELQFSAAFRTFGNVDHNPSVTWSVTGNNSSSTTINASTGKLTVAQDETADSLTVTAVYQANNSISASYTVSVDKITAVNVTPATATVAKGGNQTFTATTVTASGKTLTGAPVTWSVTGDSNASIGTDGVLTVPASTTATTLTVTATSQYVNTVSGTATVTVKEPSAGDTIKDIEPGSATPVTINDIEWYVLAKKDGKALILSKNILETRTFDKAYGEHTTPDNRWMTSEIRNYLNGEWLNNHATLKGMVAETTLHTIQEYNSTEVDETQDKVFLLSEADVFGTSGSVAVDPSHYTTGGAKLPAPGGTWGNVAGGNGYWWLRSPRGSTLYVAVVDVSYGSVYDSGCNGTRGVRPALWVNLES